MIEITNLTKTFHNGKGIFNVDLSVKTGEVFGFLGPNGAGKSSTIRHLMGFMKGDSGKAFIHKLDTWKQASVIQKRVGYLPGEISFLDNMTGLDFLKLMGGMRGLKDTTYRDQLIDRFQFDVHTPIRKMSKGMKQKVGIVAAFMHQPDVIILDEPTSGLDPLMQQTFIELVLEEKKRGVTIFMSSHIFSEIEKACDRVAIIKDGRIVATETVSELRAKQTRKFLVTFSSESDLQTILSSPLQVEDYEKTKARIVVKGNYDEFLNTLSSVRVTHLDVEHQSLEDVFMNYYDRGGTK
ncbi:ABC transporter ATP-binding protein [Metabacillus iocasae]|uniref:ABC-2 type transport system ATP-binding protein n=1 Tax=Priestia iocasae TaxID=2291674 RepID=A0ABS2QWH4_9BACI|nr:ABC transporter ATP-binding protein [Metabacillus iocasae]MBM7703813.1 ABC-2 type transport system ATP-binding protein [Metabacillus iocasae]